MNQTLTVSRQSPLLWLSAIFGIVLLFLRILTVPHSFSYFLFLRLFPAVVWEIPNLLSFGQSVTGSPVSPMNLFLAIVVLCFAFCCGWSLLHALTQLGRSGYRALAPLCLNLVHLLLLVYLNEAVVVPEFYLNQPAREAIVAQIAAGDLPLENLRDGVSHSQEERKFYTVALSGAQKQLSKGFTVHPEGRVQPGEVQVVYDSGDRLQSVFFFRSSGQTGHGPAYTAFVYQANDQPSQVPEVFGVGGLTYYVGVLDSKRFQPQWYWLDVWED